MFLRKRRETHRLLSWLAKPMDSSHGKCKRQFEAEHRKVWQNGLIVVAVTIGIAIHGSRPYGPLHLMGVCSGIILTVFHFAQLIPSSYCLRVCERGLVIRTLFIRQFIRWESIQSFSVVAGAEGDRVAIHVDPSLGIGRTVPLHFTYRLPASELAQTLQQNLPA